MGSKMNTFKYLLNKSFQISLRVDKDKILSYNIMWKNRAGTVKTALCDAKFSC